MTASSLLHNMHLEVVIFVEGVLSAIQVHVVALAVQLRITI